MNDKARNFLGPMFGCIVYPDERIYLESYADD